MPLRIVQLTDCHLLADPAAELKGICTRSRFHAVVAALAGELSRADRLIVTGDLTHDERIESYEAVRAALTDWLPRLRLLPGNHDDRALMRQAFPELASVCADRLCFVEDLGHWRWIGLDSQLTGSTAGRLGADQLAWLDRQLSTCSDQPTLLCVHHPPVAMNSPWLDTIDLQDAADLWKVIRRHPQVRVIASGHVHQESVHGSLPATVLTTPSTSVQFVPESDILQVDQVPPGYRVLCLHDDGRFTTRVVRVPVESPVIGGDG